MSIDLHPPNFAHLPRPVMPQCPPQSMLRGQKALVTGASSGIGHGRQLFGAHRFAGRLGHLVQLRGV
jgi:hypothetical protein